MKTRVQTKTGWKFLQYKNGKIVSDFDDSPWAIGVERTIQPLTKLCRGLNCSKRIYQARNYVDGDVLAKVRYSGKTIDAGDKITCERMTLVKAWHVTWATRAEYNKAAAQAQAEYDKAAALAWAECEKAMERARAGFYKRCEAVWHKLIPKLEEIKKGKR